MATKTNEIDCRACYVKAENTGNTYIAVENKDELNLPSSKYVLRISSLSLLNNIDAELEKSKIVVLKSTVFDCLDPSHAQFTSTQAGLDKIVKLIDGGKENTNTSETLKPASPKSSAPVKKAPPKKVTPPVKKEASKPTPAKETTPKQVEEEKVPVKKAPAKRPPAKKAPARKAPVKRTAAKKPAASKAKTTKPDPKS